MAKGAKKARKAIERQAGPNAKEGVDVEKLEQQEAALLQGIEEKAPTPTPEPNPDSNPNPDPNANPDSNPNADPLSNPTPNPNPNSSPNPNPKSQPQFRRQRRRLPGRRWKRPSARTRPSVPLTLILTL